MNIRDVNITPTNPAKPNQNSPTCAVGPVPEVPLVLSQMQCLIPRLHRPILLRTNPLLPLHLLRHRLFQFRAEGPLRLPAREVGGPKLPQRAHLQGSRRRAHLPLPRLRDLHHRLRRHSKLQRGRHPAPLQRQLQRLDLLDDLLSTPNRPAAPRNYHRPLEDR